MTIESLRANILVSIDQTMQIERGKEIDARIQEIQNVIESSDLSQDYRTDQLSELQFKRIKKYLVYGSVVLAVAAVVATVASIIFAAGKVAAGALTLAIVSGMLSITTSFNGLDGTLRRYLEYMKEEKTENNRLNKVKKKISNVSTLIHSRIESLKNIPKEYIVDREEYIVDRGQAILDQINRINACVTGVRQAVPERSMDFPWLDQFPLLAVASPT
ncbi:MAG: hypothetical protein WB791_08225 [Waddliaceae bacterium]